MKHFLFSIVLLIGLSVQAQCPTPDLILDTQAAVDSFQTDYPGCTIFPGDLIISGADITNLNALSPVTGVLGVLQIELTSLTDLTGLDNLTEVGTLTIDGNSALTSISQLANVTSGFNIGVTITDNPVLQSLQGLFGVSANAGDFYIGGNASLIDLQGLEGCQTTGPIFIEGNDSLLNLAGLGNVVTTSQLIIDSNPMLTTLDGLSPSVIITQLELTNNLSLTDIDVLDTASLEDGSGLSTLLFIVGNVLLETCDYVASCGLIMSNPSSVTINNNASGCGSVSEVEAACAPCGTLNIVLTSQAEVDAFPTNYPSCGDITAGLRIEGSDITNLAALTSITSIDGGLVIQNSPLLSNFAGLENVTSITGGNFEIVNNVSLTSIAQLTSLTVCDFSIVVLNNPVLSSLQGLQQITTTTDDIYIQNNDALVDLDGLGGYLSSDDVFIGDNDSLTSLNGLSNLELTGEFTISNNDALTTLDGITNLDMVFFLIIDDNAVLTDITALENTDLSGGPGGSPSITVTNNPMLSQCSIDSFCNLVGPFIAYDFSNNDVGCNSPNEVSDGCQDCPVGTIVLSSQAEVDAFIIDNPDCTEITGSLQITGAGIVNLNGLSNIVSIDGFLEVSGTVALADLSGLDALESVGWFVLSDNSGLASLSGLDNLTQAPFEVSRISNNAELTDLTALSNLVDIGAFFIENNDILVSLDGLQSLQTILFELVISDNEILSDISSLENLDLDGITLLTIQDNPVLATCSIASICSYISDNGATVIQNNAAGCNSAMEIEDECDNTFSEIKGQLLYDFNSNGCDNGDYPANGILVDIESVTKTRRVLTDGDGNYSALVEPDDYTVSIVDGSLPTYYTATPASIDITFMGAGEEATADFCLQETQSVTDVSVVVLPLQQPRPGFDSRYVVQYENIGTTIQSGEIIFDFDETIMEYVSSSQTPASTTVNSIVWNYTDLLPFESKTLEVRFSVFPPPAVEGGELLISDIQITPISSDDAQDNNLYQLIEGVVNSYDPNDKQVLQGDEIAPDQTGEYLDYIVRFQNTGSASAITVRIDDVLSDNLNWDSFKSISASHDYTVEITDENEVSFLFENINLPAESQDEAGSNGYVAFKVRTNTGLPLGSTIENTASIFFDFNPPIITNTVVTTVAEPLSVDDFLNGAFSVFPNPVEQMVNVTSNGEIVLNSLELFTLQGIYVKSTASAELDMSELANGIYFLKITSDQGSITKKLIKM